MILTTFYSLGFNSSFFILYKFLVEIYDITYVIVVGTIRLT